MAAAPSDGTVNEEDDAALLEQAQQLLSAGQAKEDRGDAAGAVQLYEQVRACGRRIKDVQLAKLWESRAVRRLGTLGACFGRPEPYRCLASPADRILAPIFRPAVWMPTVCVSFAGWGRCGGGVRCVVRVSAV